MRHYLRKIIIAAGSFFIAYALIPTIKLGPDPKNLILVLSGLVIISLIIHPIFSIVLLPVNHLTFGLLMFVLNVAFIFALMNYLPGFKIDPYNFPGANINGFIVPSYFFTGIAVVILVALIITITQKVAHIIFE